MEIGIPQEKISGKAKITTIKLSKETKDRLNHLKIYRRETYEEIMERVLEILNICRINPERAKAKLLKLERERKRNMILLVSQGAHNIARKIK